MTSNAKDVHSAVDGLKKQYLIVKKDIQVKEAFIRDLKLQM